MPRDRFRDILSRIHFSDNTLPKTDPLQKIKPVVDILRKTFRETIIPSENLSIDESMMPWKGRLSFKQYIANKRCRFGIKSFELVDCETGYLIDFIIYTGKPTPVDLIPELGFGGSVVMELLKPYLNKGHKLYIDNWYTSPALLRHLLTHQTHACGTVRPNRLGMPQFVNKLNPGDMEWYTGGNILAIKYRDRRDVHVLTTLHQPVMVTQKVTARGEAKQKPEPLVHYSMQMGGVDQIDMKLSFTRGLRKTFKWYRKLWFHLFELILYNSFIMYRVYENSKESFRKFKLELVREILDAYGPQLRTIGRPSRLPRPDRCYHRSFPIPFPTNSRGLIPYRTCVVCPQTTGIRRETRYYFAICGPRVPLHEYPCFQTWHTEEEVWKGESKVTLERKQKNNEKDEAAKNNLKSGK